eukprot:131418-Pleurochrysis_carterae.AAC.2
MATSWLMNARKRQRAGRRVSPYTDACAQRPGTHTHTVAAHAHSRSTRAQSQHTHTVASTRAQSQHTHTVFQNKEPQGGVTFRCMTASLLLICANARISLRFLNLCIALKKYFANLRSVKQRFAPGRIA